MATLKNKSNQTATPKKKVVKKKAAKKKPPLPQKELSTEEVEDKRRADWEINNELISECFFKHVLKNKKFPTYQKVADTLKLDVKTVKRHFKDDEMFDDLKIKMKALSNKALMTLAVKAMQGTSHQWSRLFFEVMDEVKGKEAGAIIIPQGGISNDQFEKLLNVIRESKTGQGK